MNYAPTTLGVQSSSENISGGTRTKKVECHWSKVYLIGTLTVAVEWLSHLLYIWKVLGSSVKATYPD